MFLSGIDCRINFSFNFQGLEKRLSNFRKHGTFMLKLLNLFVIISPYPRYTETNS